MIKELSVISAGNKLYIHIIDTENDVTHITDSETLNSIFRVGQDGSAFFFGFFIGKFVLNEDIKWKLTFLDITKKDIQTDKESLIDAEVVVFKHLLGVS